MSRVQVRVRVRVSKTNLCVCVRVCGQLMNRTFAAPVYCLSLVFLSVLHKGEQSVLRISGLTAPHKIKSSVMNQGEILC